MSWSIPGKGMYGSGEDYAEFVWCYGRAYRMYSRLLRLRAKHGLD